MNNAYVLNGRRYAAGIDINAKGIRLVVMSRRLMGPPELCVEHIGIAPLSDEAMAGPELIDPAAVSCSIVSALGTFYSPRVAASLRVAMAIAPSATLIASVPRAQLDTAPGNFGAAASRASAGRSTGRARSRARLHDLALDDLEPAVRAHVEARLGIERSALAVDWFAGRGPLSTPDHLTIAAAAREHIDARIDAAAGAGLQLIAIDAEPVAALRACRYDATREVDPDEIYAVLWLGDDSTHLWAIHQGRPIRELRVLAQRNIPTSLLASLAVFAKSITSESTPDARNMPFAAEPVVLDCAFVAGDLDSLIDAGITLDDISIALGCSTFEFDAACQCEGRVPVALPAIRPAALAVAFGLALRSVLQ